MRFFEDTNEIEYQMDILREDIKAGVIKESIPFLDLVALALKTYVEGLKNKEDLWLFSQCRSCSDALDSRRHCSCDETRSAMDALSSLLFLKEGIELAEPENQTILFSQVAELEQRLKNVLLYKFQGPSVAASILRSKRQKHNKSKNGISALADYLVEKANGIITANECWDAIAAQEEWSVRFDTGEEFKLWVNGDELCQSVYSRGVVKKDDTPIKKDSFRRYMTKAKKKFEKKSKK